MTIEIKKISNPSDSDYENAIVHSTPIIVTDYYNSWPAMSKWNLDYFINTNGSKVIDMDCGGTSFAATNSQDATLKDYIQLVKQEEPIYVNQVNIAEQLPNLLNDIFLPEYFAKNDRLLSRFCPSSFRSPQGVFELFIGGPGAGFSKLHYDIYHLGATIIQLKGNKHFRLFSPDDSKYLYVNKNHPHLSEVDEIFHPSEEIYPDIKEATPYDFTLQQGEALYIPSGWWHATKFEEQNIAVAFNTLSKFDWPLFSADCLREAEKSSQIKYFTKKLHLMVVDCLMRISGR